MVMNGVSEIIATAAASFFLGWTLKNSQFRGKLLNMTVPSMTDTKMVIVVRSDLPMTKGKLAAQCSHAAVSCYRQSMITCPGISKIWVSNGEPKIILKSDSPGEEYIKKLAKKAAEAGLVASIIRDAGRTQVPQGSITVLGIGPGSVSKIDQGGCLGEFFLEDMKENFWQAAVIANPDGVKKEFLVKLLYKNSHFENPIISTNKTQNHQNYRQGKKLSNIRPNNSNIQSQTLIFIKFVQ